MPDIANEIISRVWLGNAKASMDDTFLQQHQITVVFNCTKNYPFSPLIPTKYRVPVDDNLQEEEIRNMELWSSEIAYRLVTEYRAGKTILVHCAAGMQRSAAAVAMLLITLTGCTTKEAIHRIQERRSIAFTPQANFLRAIQTYDRRFHSEILPQIESQTRG